MNNSPTDCWTEEEWDKFKGWLKGMLKMGPVTVTFTKKDGTDRVMKCTLEPTTLEPTALPPVEIKENKVERKKSENSIAVYDLDVKGWRSFTFKSVKNVSITI